MMPQSQTIRVLPRWVVVLATLAISFHFLAIGLFVLSAQSGPWPSPNGPDMVSGPQFAGDLGQTLGDVYLFPLHMLHNYHFDSNRPEMPSVYFEARLKDNEGNVIETLKFPRNDLNFWARHRQRMLAQSLGDDIPVQPPRGEVIPAPGQKMRELTIWEPVEGDTVLKLKKVEEHLVPRDRPVARPTRWSLLLARSYMRYLCRKYKADSVELIRHSREAIAPENLLIEQPGAFEEMIGSFGVYRAEK
jgi:hypothetical protein